jgi:predicted amidohydrolase YtcJ
MRPLIIALAAPSIALAQGGRATQPQPTEAPTLIVPARVWDGTTAAPREGLVVLVRGDRIDAVGTRSQVNAPTNARVIDLPGTTLIPGMIEAHSHLLLHPYNEASWTTRSSASTKRCASRGRPTTRATPSWRASPPSATSAPKALAMPTSD